MTAWHAIVDTGVIKKGGDSKRVFINGGTGAVGIQAIQVCPFVLRFPFAGLISSSQIAKLHGAHVTVSCSSGESASLVKSLGADETIDYKSVSLPSHLSSNNSLASGKAFDLIFDAVGSHTLFAASAAFLKPDGKYLDIAGGIHFDSLSDSINTLIALFNQLLRPRFLGGTPRKFQILLVPAAKMGAQLQQAADLLESKDLRTVIDSTYKFEDALAAYERQMSGRFARLSLCSTLLLILRSQIEGKGRRQYLSSISVRNQYRNSWNSISFSLLISRFGSEMCENVYAVTSNANTMRPNKYIINPSSSSLGRENSQQKRSLLSAFVAN